MLKNEYKMVINSYTHRLLYSIKENIIKETCQYLRKYKNIKSLILGVSGGADSALVAILASEVVKIMKHRYSRDIKLIGRSLPIETNTKDEIERAADIGNLLCCNFKEVNLYDIYVNMANEINEIAEDEIFGIHESKIPIMLGNIKARIRMIYLYNLAQLHDGIVLSTDNYSEYLLGFWTLHGDVGDFGMIQNLWKTEIYYLLNWFVKVQNSSVAKFENIIQPCIDATPTDGLGITQSDFEQFGDIKSYQEVDILLQDYLTNGIDIDLIKNGGKIPKVFTLHENSQYKRNNPFNIPRNKLIS